MKQFAKEANIPYRTLQNIKGGVKPGSDTLLKIKTKYSVSLDWLLSGEGEMFEKTPASGARQVQSVPVLGKVPAGFPECIPNCVSEEVLEYIGVPDVPSRSYALKVKGDSMSPVLKDDDYAIFMPDQDIRSGDVVIVNNEWGETMIKRYMIKEGKVFLISDNPEYPTLKPNEHYKIIGKVIKGWRSLKI